MKNPWSFNYSPGVDVREGFDAIKALILDNMACSKESRYFILCWVILIFLRDHIRTNCLLQFTGSSSVGKSAAASLLSALIYGEERSPASLTPALMYRNAEKLPLVFVDNYESPDFSKSILNFLLLSAEKGQRGSRQPMQSNILITSIEPFRRPELVNRTCRINFDYKYKTDIFKYEHVVKLIAGQRDLLLSAIFSRCFHALAVDKKIEILKRDFKKAIRFYRVDKSSRRNDEHLAIIILILDIIWPFLGEEPGTMKNIIKAWVAEPEAVEAR